MLMSLLFVLQKHQFATTWCTIFFQTHVQIKSSDYTSTHSEYLENSAPPPPAFYNWLRRGGRGFEISVCTKRALFNTSFFAVVDAGYFPPRAFSRRQPRDAQRRTPSDGCKNDTEVDAAGLDDKDYAEVGNED